LVQRPRAKVARQDDKDELIERLNGIIEQLRAENEHLRAENEQLRMPRF
jgi:cell division protein FtsB